MLYTPSLQFNRGYFDVSSVLGQARRPVWTGFQDLVLKNSDEAKFRAIHALWSKPATRALFQRQEIQTPQSFSVLPANQRALIHSHTGNVDRWIKEIARGAKRNTSFIDETEHPAFLSEPRRSMDQIITDLFRDENPRAVIFKKTRGVHGKGIFVVEKDIWGSLRLTAPYDAYTKESWAPFVDQKGVTVKAEQQLIKIELDEYGDQLISFLESVRAQVMSEPRFRRYDAGFVETFEPLLTVGGRAYAMNLHFLVDWSFESDSPVQPLARSFHAYQGASSYFALRDSGDRKVIQAPNIFEPISAQYEIHPDDLKHIVLFKAAKVFTGVAREFFDLGIRFKKNSSCVRLELGFVDEGNGLTPQPFLIHGIIRFYPPGSHDFENFYKETV